MIHEILIASVNCISERQIEIAYAAEINIEVNLKLHQLSTALNERFHNRILEIVVGYHKLAIYLDPYAVDVIDLSHEIESFLNDFEQDQSICMKFTGRTIRIPVCYDDEFALDLDDLCLYTGISKQEVIKRHTSPSYHAYMIGFLPGFPYLGGLDVKIHMPRKEVPRKSIFKGAVGIAGGQTGVYPIQSPGGWQIIGGTPLELFDLDHDQPSIIKAGDSVTFVEIDLETYHKIKEGKQKWEVFK